jgi:hypothetical protein
VAQPSPPGTGETGDHSSSMPRSAPTPGALWLGWTTVAAVLLPVLITIWTIPGFMTQDGPTHLYNSWILAQSFSPHSPYQDYYRVQWQPLPNWAGHLALAGLLRVVSPAAADRLMMSVTLLGFAATLVWLRWRVRGDKGIVGAGVLSAILALNFPWLLGFYSFLLGCCLFPITLGVWWLERDRLGPLRLAGLACLLVLGYFGHLVSLGLTVAALGFFALFAPAAQPEDDDWPHRLKRASRTAVPCLVLVPLALVYLRLSRQGGPMRPVWENLSDPFSLLAWVSRLRWVDPLTLAKKDMLPFTTRTHLLFVVFAPVVWIAGAGLLLVADGIGRRCRRTARRAASPPPPDHESDSSSSGRLTRRIWLAFGLSLLLAGLLGPDSLGSGHGEYLPQRLELLGLAALVPAVDFRLDAIRGRLAWICLLVATSLQSLIVWDYAIYSDRTAGQVMRARDLVGHDQRLATVLIRINSRFRSNSLLHADGWLGVGTGNILWSNYEALYYYFPVQFRTGIIRPNPRRFEELARATDPEPGTKAIRLWEQILAPYHGTIDKVVAWHRDPVLDEVTTRWYAPVDERGEIRVFTHSIPPEEPHRVPDR